MSNVQLISGGLGVIVALVIFVLVRKDMLHSRDGIRWLVAAFLVLAVGLAPGLVDQIGHTLGISYPPIVVMLGGLAVLLIKLLISDIQRASMRVDIERLVQKVAILEAELNQQKNTKGERK